MIFELQHDLKKATQQLIKREWISIDDRLPEYNTYVMVYVPSHKMPFQAFYKSLGWVSPYVEVHEGITHWQPLSEPPTK